MESKTDTNLNRDETMTSATKKNLASSNVPKYLRETILEDPSDYTVRKSIMGCIKVTFMGEFSDWYFMGREISYCDSDIYSPYRVGGYRRGRSFEKLSQAIAYIANEKSA